MYSCKWKVTVGLVNIFRVYTPCFKTTWQIRNLDCLRKLHTGPVWVVLCCITLRSLWPFEDSQLSRIKTFLHHVFWSCLWFYLISGPGIGPHQSRVIVCTTWLLLPRWNFTTFDWGLYYTNTFYTNHAWIPTCKVEFINKLRVFHNINLDPLFKRKLVLLKVSPKLKNLLFL